MTTTAKLAQPNAGHLIHQDTQALRRDVATILELARNTALPMPGESMSVLDAMLGLLQTIWLVESKSLKLYLTSFRNHGAFHEDCTVSIGRRLVSLLEPRWLRIGGYWYPRGGIPIDVFWQTGVVPQHVWLPDTGVPAYRGRG